MRLNELSLRNFRAYCGEHTIDLRPIDGNQLTLIFGENMGGKTSLFLALTWCLYGRATGRLGEEIPVFLPGAESNNNLINAVAVESGDYDVWVRLDFEHDRQNWVLERKASCAGDPLEGEPFTEDVFLRIDGGMRSRHEIKPLVNRVIHHEASQFYFFDGELLAQYERWLDDPHERDIRVRQAVERVVGIAALRLHPAIEEVAAEAEAALRRSLARERREEQLVLAYEEQRRRISEVESEIQDYDDRAQLLRDESERIEREYGELAQFIEERGRLEEIARQIDDANEAQRSAEAALRQLVRERYWLPLAHREHLLRQDLTDSIERSITASGHAERAHLLDQSLHTGTCSLCERPLDVGSRARLKASRSDLALASFSQPDASMLRVYADQLRACDLFRSEGEAERIRLHEDSRLEARSKILQLEEDDEQIRRRYEHRPRGDRDEQMQRLQHISEELGRTRQHRADAVIELERLRDDLASLQTRVNRIQSGDPATQRLARISRLAVESFKLAIDGFAEAARVRVEEAASSVFGQLVAAPGYTGLRIGRDYGLTTVDGEGNPLPTPSAGGQQLVTLALIGGLNAAAVHEAPIVMDTPAGRIDRPNRERILRWVQNLDRQVILMVHSGEFTPDEVQRMQIDVGRTYQISKTSPKASEILPTSLERRSA